MTANEAGTERTPPTAELTPEQIAGIAIRDEWTHHMATCWSIGESVVVALKREGFTIARSAALPETPSAPSEIMDLAEIRAASKELLESKLYVALRELAHLRAVVEDPKTEVGRLTNMLRWYMVEESELTGTIMVHADAIRNELERLRGLTLGGETSSDALAVEHSIESLWALLPDDSGLIDMSIAADGASVSVFAGGASVGIYDAEDSNVTAALREALATAVAAASQPKDA